MEVSGINIYPIKSLGGIQLKNSEVGLKGLKFDRRYVLVDENGVFVSQRSIPEMCLFHTSILENGFEIINTQNTKKLTIPFELIEGEELMVKVWDDNIRCFVASDDVNDWFSENFGMKLRLCYQPDDSIRNTDPRYSSNENDQTSLSDGYPILIISEESIEELNKQCPEQIDIKRFRPNIVIKGLPAFGEDELGRIIINGVEMLGVKKCARCQVINIDFETGKLGKEPLQSMKDFRKLGNKILLGINIIARSSGYINVGDFIKF
jgi:uncharacterized protein